MAGARGRGMRRSRGVSWRKKRVRECVGKKGASPGIEPGPLAPEANIIPLNYEAVQVRSLEDEYKGK